MITNSTELIAFLQRYHRTVLEEEPPQSILPAEIEPLIPEPLKKLYDAFGHHIDGYWGPLSSQDHLRPPSKLRFENDEVVFLDENQGCWSCACQSSTPGHPVIRYDDGPEGTRLTETLEEFLITFALQEAAMSSPWLLSVEGVPSAHALGLELSDLYRQGRYVSEEPSHDFWITPQQDVICMDVSDIGFWLASYSPRLLELRLPHYEYQIITPRDPSAAKTYGESTDWLSRAINRFTSWFSKKDG